MTSQSIFKIYISRMNSVCQEIFSLYYISYKLSLKISKDSLKHLCLLNIQNFHTQNISLMLYITNFPVINVMSICFEMLLKNYDMPLDILAM